MVRKITLLLFALVVATGAFSQTSLEGVVTEDASAMPIPFATVALFKEGALIQGTDTDFDGNYFFSNIDPGTYDVEFSFLGYATSRITGVIVKAGKVNKVDAKMIEEGVMLEDIVITGYKVPLVEFDNTTQGGIITADDIRALPTKNINALAATTAGISNIDGGNDVSIRGSRSDATYYYIDGVRVRSESVGNNIPQAEIDQLQVVTGGIEAKYGDVTGGIISITTKGPSAKFSGGFEAETSEFLDAYGYNLLNANISGPIVKKKDGEPLIGFRFSGQYQFREDDDPSARGDYRASEETIRQLEENPRTNFQGSSFPSAEFLTFDDIAEPVKTRPNEEDEDYNLVGKIDAKISNNVDVTLSGSYFQSKNRFEVNRQWNLLNWVNNPVNDSRGYRGNFRIRHKLGNQSYGSGSGSGEEEKNSIIQNASYSIQFGYEKYLENREDFRHQENLFNYGYYGHLENDWNPTASIITDTSAWEGEEVFVNGVPWAHQGYQQVTGEYTPNTDINKALSNFYDLNGFDGDFTALGEVWALYENVGQVYNRFSKEEEDRYTVNLDLGFDLLPGGSNKGKHNLQFGFMYEQRTNRFWNVAPRDLWTLARIQANRHLESGGVDTEVVIDTFSQNVFGQNTSFLQYQTNSQADQFADNLFFREIRKVTGQSENEFVNTDGLDPSQLSLDMFSASELNDRNLLSYYGYDYLGNKVGGDVSFSDFFTGTDADGRRTFTVAPLQPIYSAGYIQDKFTFKDIIFRLGLRVDYYDANTNVLKDPYSLYEIEDASEFFTRVGQEQPESVGDDYKVYVIAEGSETVAGFRKDDQWFKSDGTSVSDGTLLFGGGLVNPSLKEADTRILDIQDPDFDPNVSFKDYDPQLNWMPRLAFSFPINEDAGFFAHYDVLVQRPPDFTQGTALRYYYFTDTRFSSLNNPAPNPDLRPEKTVDYEVGFQQKLSNSSALKVSAYYKELRDMIQRRFYRFIAAPVGAYETFGNIDFGTVKGLVFSYDLRRTSNIEIKTSYTLQFADATGSDTESSQGLNERGNLRNIFPLSYDERHRIATTIDYRYASGKQYNGPRIGGSDILANAGANLIITAVSGRPYSTYSSVNRPVSEQGLQSINTARKPWIFNVDFQLDKQFDFVLNKKENPDNIGNNRTMGVNVYLRIQNLLNTLNTIDVYPITGDPQDDGFLVSTFGQDRIDQIADEGRDPDSFRAFHSWRVQDPDHFTRPRRIFVGAIVNF